MDTGFQFQVPFHASQSTISGLPGSLLEKCLWTQTDCNPEKGPILDNCAFFCWLEQLHDILLFRAVPDRSLFDGSGEQQPCVTQFTVRTAVCFLRYTVRFLIFVRPCYPTVALVECTRSLLSSYISRYRQLCKIYASLYRPESSLRGALHRLVSSEGF